MALMDATAWKDVTVSTAETHGMLATVLMGATFLKQIPSDSMQQDVRPYQSKANRVLALANFQIELTKRAPHL